MLGIQGGEFLMLAVVALIVLGPEKLPRYAADAARMIRQVRRMARSARDEVTRDLGPEFQDISIADLDPRRFVTRHLLDDDFGLDDDEDAPPRTRSRPAPPSVSPGSDSAFDPDAT